MRVWVAVRNVYFEFGDVLVVRLDREVAQREALACVPGAVPTEWRENEDGGCTMKFYHEDITITPWEV